MHINLSSPNTFGYHRESITFTNPEPVGTGPFTKFCDLTLRSGSWVEIQITGKKANLKSICCVFLLPSNEQSTFALLQGEVDWARNFLPLSIGFLYPKIQKITTIGSFGWNKCSSINHTKEHLNDILSKALSMAIDREKMVQIQCTITQSPLLKVVFSCFWGLGRTRGEMDDLQSRTCHRIF